MSEVRLLSYSRPVSPVYSVDYSVQQRAASLLNPAVYCNSGSVLSDWRSLSISSIQCGFFSPAESSFTPESCSLFLLRSSSLRLEEFEARSLHNIFSSLLNPPAPPSQSSLTAEDFATFYTEKIERISQTFTSIPTSPTSHSQHSATPSLMQLSTVAAEEVLQITRSCNPTTCPLDPIPSAMLQTISPDLLPFITTVINGSLTSGHVPTVFKKARVIPILKKPALDPSDISNYRPVSLLSFLSKILERVVCNQLSDYLMQNNLHDPNQSGFKAAHSTETALLAVTEKLHAARSAKLSSVLILLDLSAAFDTVNHKTLLSTLRSLGICGTAWEWFASYRSYQETWKGLTSAPRRLSTGVPQDSVLGPLLFSLYTHSLYKAISSHGFSYHCYADDTQLIFSFPPSDTTASAQISACLVDISSWMTAHQLKFNPSKTELLIIPGDLSPAQDLAISLSNSMISPSATARNLGLHTLATPHPPPLTPLTIKEEKLNRLFKLLNTHKATGPDSISPSLLKHGANQLSPVFTDIFNISRETCHVPACFKTSAIVPVPKKTKITGLNDYRPVTLTSVVMKSYEHLMLSYHKDITDPLLDPLQFAYRANRSVDDAVNMALHFILQHLDFPGSYARILFVDFSSSFNTIVPALLRDKLFQLNVPDSCAVGSRTS
ncbi:hypothetical protein QTP86_000793 [Hemibagrus guttatus]|nr:hypothetical protein QTP86_000793 [Hemibagrus guttatus]